MGDTTVGLSVAEAAAAMGVGKTTARTLFDVSAGAGGTVDPATGARRFDPSWVADQAARRIHRQSQSVPDALSVAEVAARIQVGKNTVRRWFDRDQPMSGVVVEGGRTGGTERRCDPGWVAAVEAGLRARLNPPG